MTGDRILVLEAESPSRQHLETTLANAGLNAVTAHETSQALCMLDQGAVSLVLVRLPQEHDAGVELIAALRACRADIPIIAMASSGSNREIKGAFESGADDYIHQPLRPAELMTRIKSQLRIHGYIDRLSRKEHGQQTIIELTQALASSLDIRDILFTVAKRVAEVAHVDRCSIVMIRDSSKGYVVASSDDETLRDLAIDLANYPEIRQCIAHGTPLVISDASNHPLLQVARQSEPGLMFNSLAVMPILHDQEAMGVLFLRSKQGTTYTEHDLDLVRTAANATAIALRNAQLMQSLRDETEQSAYARVEAERRLQLFQRYADFFESAAEGMIVIDREGQILFANTRTREITGYSETELINMSLPDLMDEQELERARGLLSGFEQGIYPRGIDANFNTKMNEPIVLNLSFSSVLHEDNAILLNFRDVTGERRTAIELVQTKEFLERVIESSVDAIVAADLRGCILLFNRAAARIFGYEPAEVIGKRVVEKLYPPGIARLVMKRIRDPAFGGAGRLEDFRVDMMNAEGEHIPVMLSAALVMGKEKPMGSVGIFTDIRDKLQMQARLDRAQQELQSRERQAILAELAGAAAHELNQPLTSIIGYAELLRRRLGGASAELAHAAAVIISESERMAEIVRKVGRITHYETKSYVGGAKILDLEKASEEPPPAEDIRR